MATIKNRTSIPGGACEFDLPAYHHWLARPVDDRLRDLVVWTAPFVPLREAITLTLKLLRDSGRSQTGIAQNGQFQQMTTGKTFHLARLKVAGDEPVVPELSANRYALMIRFISVIDGESRPKQTDRDVPFELTLGSF